MAVAFNFGTKIGAGVGPDMSAALNKTLSSQTCSGAAVLEEHHFCCGGVCQREAIIDRSGSARAQDPAKVGRSHLLWRNVATVAQDTCCELAGSDNFLGSPWPPDNNFKKNLNWLLSMALQTLMISDDYLAH